METRALRIIENYCGQSFRKSQVNERTTLQHNMGRLTHEIVEIVAIKARSNSWVYSDVFGSSGWVEIDPSEIPYEGNQIVVYGDYLGTHYSEADVTYTYGHAEIPQPVQTALDLLVRQIQANGTKNAFSSASLITPEIADLLAPYKTYNGGAL
ncbi:hypothetical protein [Paenibacillus hexagrammi]|uniref:Uncharacterized protein n=1 Tax=Paenibacillus hexagrammi TaxID=2908839 RepID=A0ABY3SR32_9BACL|nr:hypothetical protein [Paenibacillus sp. YPD9-1]UJF36533.1 hypothetical protein L0M14_30565 [Paenibacillus sp. YPD9-1]